MKRVAWVLVLLAGCPAARGGVVPADLRDVERAGEGLVSTTFGDLASSHAPAWNRAATVLTILKEVWGRAKSGNARLPAASVARLDAAIAALETAIPARDQKAAVYAANEVGLSCPELFDFFKPDAPPEIIRMDAVYRQVGIDAHFGDLTAARKNASSLSTDWNNAKKAVSTRAPTCHRVGGTATVSGDIDLSLSNVNTALGSMDVLTIERESENGALEIDTLELLFDCPADTAAPASGLGAVCTSDAQCSAGEQCDLAWGTKGKCAPGVVNKIGTACSTTIDCGSDSRSACNTAAGDNYPGGYCFMEPCNDIDVCPPGATCVALGGEAAGCFSTCVRDADCRTTEGYVCQLFVTTPPSGFGPSNHACAFPCTRDDDCQAPLRCPNPSDGGVSTDSTFGKCTP